MPTDPQASSDPPAFPDTLGGRPAGDDWHIERHLAFSLEVPARLVEPLLPAGVSAVAPVPGVALVQLIHARYVPGTLGEAEPFDEAVCAVLAEPDLSLPMPLPRLTLHVLDVLSNSAAFVAHKVPALRMPVQHAPSLSSECLDDGLSSRVADHRGPLFELGCPDATAFKPKSFVGQYFAEQGGTLNHSVWSWSGTLFESQRARGARLVVHDHPWFEALGLTGLSRARCFLRQVSAPGASIAMRTYAPRQLGPQANVVRPSQEGERPRA